MTDDVFEKIVSLRNKGARLALATIIARKGASPRKETAKMLVDETGRRYGTIGGGSVEENVFQEALRSIRSGSSKILSFDLSGMDVDENGLVCGGHMEVYVEPIVPDPALYIFGAGNVCKSLSDLARFAGFKVAIADDRREFLNKERFPSAERFYEVDTWEELFGTMELSDHAYVFISTREHAIDAACLYFALRSRVRYIGMLGSMKKIALLKEFLAERKIDPSEFERVSIPVGLDIGAETPEEIAVSIMAELIASRKNRDVASIRSAVRTAAACTIGRG